MGLAGYNPLMGQHLKTGNPNIFCDRAFVAHYQIAAADADAAAAAYIEAATVLDAEKVTTVLAKDLSAQPPTPRVLSITGDAAGSVGDVVINGTDANGAALTETIVGTGKNTVSGTKAFASVTSIVFPIGDGTSTISVGITDDVGLPFCLPYNTVLLILNNATATTVASGSYSATVISQNYINPTAPLAGAQIDIYFLV